MNADHLQIRVSAHLEDKRGIYQIVLSWNDVFGKRCRKSISTGLPIFRNKKRAEDIMRVARDEQEALVNSDPKKIRKTEVLFADYMERWLEQVRPDLKPTTYGNHQCLVQRVIGPYFREKEIKLVDLTPADVLAFYKKQMEHVKATTVHKYHNVFSRVLKLAVEEELIERSPMEKIKRPKVEKFIGKFLKESEIVELFEAVKGHKLVFLVS